MDETEASYFVNHARRERFPWLLYHRELDVRIARAVAADAATLAMPRVLVVGCGLDPGVRGVRAIYYGSDLDARAIEACKAAHPELAARLLPCPSPFEQPDFGVVFDAIVAKEVVEHSDDPARFARSLSERLRPGGTLVLTTPNYGRFSTLALLERTVLEWIARRDGYSRAHIHPSRFDRAGLAALDAGADMKLERVETTWSGWGLVGVWRKARGSSVRT
jgi:2-polyprenyl-3-methyl-5-hydroxy-6-metoxy-1,4-benzoquinol methylase